MSKHIIKSLSLGRVFNLGNYETVRYGVEIEVGPTQDPGELLKELETLMDSLRPVVWTEELQRAHEYCLTMKSLGHVNEADPSYRNYAQQLLSYQEAQTQAIAARKKLTAFGGDLTNHVGQ